MCGVFEVLFDILVTILKYLMPSGRSWLLAEHVLVRQQLIALSRRRSKSPPLTSLDRIVLAISSVFINPSRLPKLAIVVAHSTLLKFHRALVNRKYSILFSGKHWNKPGPNGPSPELVALIVGIKTRNPRYGCPKIALLASNVLKAEVSEDMARRILRKHYRPLPVDGHGPSWLAAIGNATDKLWSLDLFCCESILLKTHWVMIVMDQYSRAIVGFAVHAGSLNGEIVCQMFNKISANKTLPRYLSTDHDPLFKYRQWEANLRIGEIEHIRSCSGVPVSHPFVERLIGTTRREYLDHVFFWNEADLERKLQSFAKYNDEARVHYSLNGLTPQQKRGGAGLGTINLTSYAWKSYCNGLFQIPVPA